MTLESVDEILVSWSKRHGMSVATSYQDEEVRSIQHTIEGKNRIQIWLDPPTGDGQIVVHVWDYGDRVAKFRSSLTELESNLDKALVTAENWS